MTDNSSNIYGDLSKRDFLQTIGMLGGSAAMFAAMGAFDKSIASDKTEPPKMATDGNGKKIVVLGAGLAGMVLGLELSKKGYDVEILEARSFAGGRCQSARKGSVIQEIGGEKQVCDFDNNQYINHGPWRIAQEHHSTLYYCNTLNVELQPMINESAQTFIYSEKAEGPLKGKRIRHRHAEVDRHGNIYELLAKCASDGSLDDKMTAEDRDNLIEHLKTTGLLDRRDLNYITGRARGFEDYPGAGMHFGTFSEPYNFSDLLKVRVGARWDTADHPAVMFQAVGGMDRIAHAMFDALPKGMVKFNKEVTKIEQTDDGAQVSYFDTNTGKEETASGDYCITTIPFGVLNQIENDFAAETIDAIKSPRSAPAYKIGLQFDRRFWEKDEMIYGGVTQTDIPGNRVISYPSSDLHSSLGGVLLGDYEFGAPAVANSNLSIAERIELAVASGEKVHPGLYRKHFNGKAMSIAWHREKYSLGGWVGWSARARRNKLPILLKGERRVLFSGNGITPILDGWMAGAIEGAWLTMEDIDKRIAQS
ncbi:flavin monoamine oxidase family protein [Pseudemcibacter aquimaris]|uniref:flavin monoamine oxidase family protein n=1 Tax=Pseudemcibacter aquimaris TaxID=2857064 RepID=UPI00201287A7|nr:flavin monoamine oxidase family protein [Pseudemcibacter aquimaris]MCC3859646.1 flavin monoamine oxidase family protein [Pseudemcibacter aquimaris]WDU60041.1 flavin monoamine oxidase family protein [Pseudemcibacter aquimaris]